jgi:hypothetical protein
LFFFLERIRVPGEDMDELVHYDTSESKHVAIVCDGYFYRLDVTDCKNQCLSAKSLEQQIQWIVDDVKRLKAEEQSDESESKSNTVKALPVASSSKLIMT